MHDNIVLIGTGRIAREYIRALKSLKKDPIIIGNSTASVSKFNNEMKLKAIPGGLHNNLNLVSDQSLVINTVQIENLHEINELIISRDPKSILVEKPVFQTIPKALVAKEFYAKYRNIYVATNRRFFESINQLRNLLVEDVPISSHFEFNERAGLLDTTQWHNDTLENWALANSVHVIDTVFHLIGQPNLVKSFSNNKKFSWTKYDRVVGYGYTDKNVVFTFNSNWITLGSWKIEIKTSKHTYTLSPMEELKKDGKTVKLKESISNTKPGFYNMILNWMNNQTSDLSTVYDFICNLEKQREIYEG